MDKKYRVFYNKGDYKRCTDYELKNEFLPQGITEFPAYVVYDDCMGKWCEVSFKGFIDYLETMKDELQEHMNDIEWYLDLNDANDD